MHLPTAIIAYLGRVLLAGKFNGDLLVRIIPTPNRAFLTLLQHHVAAKDGRKFRFGLNKNYRKEGDNTAE